MSAKICYSTAKSIILFLVTLTLFSCAGNNAVMQQENKAKVGDLTAEQTPLKDQDNRNTCGAFATIAAIEAAYKREMNIELDLSEQYLHHIQKTAWLSHPQEKLYENQSCYWGGAGTEYYVSILENYRIPEEGFCPYLTKDKMRRFVDKLQIKNFEWTAENSILQDTVDYFEYHPQHILTTAYKNAKYGAENVRFISNSNIQNKPDTLKKLLDQRIEVVTRVENHFMCLIGYDDINSEYIFKNSACKCNTKKSYNDINKIINAGKLDCLYIESVLKPQKQIEAGFLGRWYFCTDNLRGEMIIRRLGYHDPNKGIHNFEDTTRIGSFYKKPYQYWDVNGAINGDSLIFWLDFEKNHKLLKDTSSTKCKVYIYNQGKSAAYYIAGLISTKNKTSGVLLSKKQLPNQISRSGEITFLDFKGLWVMEHEGLEGLLAINKKKSFKEFDKLNEYEFIDKLHNFQFEGLYTQLSTKKEYKIKGELIGNKISFNIPFDKKNPHYFEGYLLKTDRNIIAGRTKWNNKPFGFHAFKKI